MKTPLNINGRLRADAQSLVAASRGNHFNLQANDLPDAWLAATTVQLGEQRVTFDRDFKRLTGRVHLAPLDAVSS